MEIEIAALSSQGGREYNEDVHGHWNDGHFLVCLVADGAGGHGGGDVAAGSVWVSVLEGFSAQPALDEQLTRQLLEKANADIVELQAQGGSLARMRSTAVLAVLDLLSDSLLWAHSGDSRAYLFRDHSIVARTTDHSLVQQMVNSGMLDAEGARLHPQRNVLLSALGSLDEPPQIDISERMRLRTGDVLLLCSDGVWEVLGDAGLLSVLHAARSPAQWVELLGRQITALAKPHHDNYTALIIQAGASSDDQTVLLQDSHIS